MCMIMIMSLCMDDSICLFIMKMCMVWVYVVWSYSYMHYVSLNDYMMKIVNMNGVVFTYLLMYEIEC